MILEFPGREVQRVDRKHRDSAIADGVSRMICARPLGHVYGVFDEAFHRFFDAVGIEVDENTDTRVISCASPAGVAASSTCWSGPIALCTIRTAFNSTHNVGMTYRFLSRATGATGLVHGHRQGLREREVISNRRSPHEASIALSPSGISDRAMPEDPLKPHLGRSWPSI